MPNDKGTPLTLEMFEEALLPRIGEMLDEKVEEFKEEVGKYREEVLDFKQEVLGEIEKLREETTVSTHQYRRVIDRVEVIENHLGITPKD